MKRPNYEYKDGLLKLKDLPKEMGGSGTSIPEWVCSEFKRSGSEKGWNELAWRRAIQDSLSRYLST